MNLRIASTAGLRVVLVEEHAPEDQHLVRARTGDVEAAFGHWPVVAGRQDQVPAAFAAVRAGMPKSVTQRHQASSERASAFGGVSSTIGPLLRSSVPMKYTVSAFAVRNSDFASIRVENTRISLSFTPAARKAAADGLEVRALHRVDEGVVGVREVDLVVDLRGGRRARHAVPKSSVPMRVGTVSAWSATAGFGAIAAGSQGQQRAGGQRGDESGCQVPSPGGRIDGGWSFGQYRRITM